jgi:hypothetical protein
MITLALFLLLQAQDADKAPQDCNIELHSTHLSAKDEGSWNCRPKLALPMHVDSQCYLYRIDGVYEAIPCQDKSTDKAPQDCKININGHCVTAEDGRSCHFHTDNDGNLTKTCPKPIAGKDLELSPPAYIWDSTEAPFLKECGSDPTEECRTTARQTPPDSVIERWFIQANLDGPSVCASVKRRDGYVHSMINGVEYVQTCRNGKLGTMVRLRAKGKVHEK